MPVWVGGMLETGDRPRRQPRRGGPARAWPCRPTSTRVVASTPTWPTRACPVDGAVAVPTGSGHRCRPRRRGAAVGRGRGSLVAVSELARHARRRARRRRADRRRRRAHAERPVAHALGGARHRDRREVREPAVHRGVQGARRPQQAAHRSPRTSGGAVSSPCRPGNHAQAVARHATRLGIEATIVMPAHTPFVKVQRTEVLGARVVLHGADLAEATAEAERLGRRGPHVRAPLRRPRRDRRSGHRGARAARGPPRARRAA